MSNDFLLHDVLGRLNYIDRIEGLFSALWHGDYKHAKGVTGILRELTMSVSGANTHKFSIQRRGSYSLNEVESQLHKYGITVFGRTHDGQHMHFHVKRRQARWAEYIMLHAGIELDGPLFDSRNAAYRDSHTPGWMPQPWSESGRSGSANAGSFGTGIIETLSGHDRNSSKRTSPKTSSSSGHLASHRNSVPAREPGGWLDQLDALIDDLLEQ